MKIDVERYKTLIIPDCSSDTLQSGFNFLVEILSGLIEINLSVIETSVLKLVVTVEIYFALAFHTHTKKKQTRNDVQNLSLVVR